MVNSPLIRPRISWGGGIVGVPLDSHDNLRKNYHSQKGEVGIPIGYGPMKPYILPNKTLHKMMGVKMPYID